jgi:hypothetical protein
MMTKTKTTKPTAFWEIGQSYFIRTVTHYLVGQLKAVDEHELVLLYAAWVASTGRFNRFLATGIVEECEPFPDGQVLVGRGAIIDACRWPHTLPRTVT